MAGVNKVILLGNLGRDPEVRYLPSGSAVANFSIATSEAYKDKNGNRVEQTEWHNVEVWDAQAKLVEQYLKKGSKVYVEGKIKTDTWEDNGQKRSAVKIRVNTIQFLDAKGGGGEGGQSYSSAPTASSRPVSAGDADLVADPTDDLPF